MKKSFADCSQCELQDKLGNVCLTNVPNDLSETEILFIGENGTKLAEIEKAAKCTGCKYTITSLILCEIEEGVDIFEIISKCSNNWKKIATMAKPNAVICIGDKVYFEYVGFSDKIEWYESIEAYHEKLSRDKISLSSDLSILSNNVSAGVKRITTKVKKTDTTKLHMFRIPDKFYTDEYRLVDVHYISGRQQLVHIFRDKSNKKIYYESPAVTNNYYWYETATASNKIIESHKDLSLVIGNYKARKLDSNCYESDIGVDVKHAVDYYLQSKGEPPPVDKNIFFMDIEVYTYKDKIFPSPEKACYPINAISFMTRENTETQVYLLDLKGEIDPKIYDIMKSKKYPKLTLFDSEITLLKTFLKVLREADPDFICGWNVIGFDLAYIATRLKKLKINASALSPYNNVYIDGKRNKAIISGTIALDQLILYKNFTYTKEPSYKLENISQKELGRGKKKYDGNLENIYNHDIETFIQYSLTDTVLLNDLEEKLQHVSAQDELRRAATTTHNGANSTIGQADGLMMTSLKKSGLAAKNSNHNVAKTKIIGAYVFDARGGGLKSGLLCDYDFTSLYPSIINSWNIGPNTYIAKIPNDVAFSYVFDKDSLKGRTFNIEIDPIHSGTIKKINLEDLEKIIESKHATVNITGCMYCGHDIEESIYYPVINFLFKDRKMYKKMMFDCKESGDKVNAGIFDCKQMALKILMNSLYGVLANEHFRFYNSDLASSITLTGQELLKFCAVHCNRYMEGVEGIDIRFIRNVEEQLQYVIYGDTDSLFVDLTPYLKSKNIPVEMGDRVDTVINQIQDYLNNDILSFLIDRHNVPYDRSMLQLKNEYLFSKYYAVNAKKKYATKVIAQEGRKLEFIDVKGLEIKRSDYPEITHELLQNVLEMILSDDESKSNIAYIEKYVKTIEERVKQLAFNGDPSVAKSVSFSKPLSEYLNMPQHIKGMLIWNALVNEDHRYGNRGRLFPLLGVNLDKAPLEIKTNYTINLLGGKLGFTAKDIDCIVIPDEVDKLPEYFDVDIKRMVDFTVHDRIAIFLEPLIKKVDNPLW